MTLADIYSILQATGFPVAYSHFDEMTPTPFITYLVSYSSNFMADNKVHTKIDNLQIELYTSKKDLESESKLENLLDENEIPYQTTETYINSENVFQKIYEVRLYR